MVISEALATRLWPGEPALGKVLILPWGPNIRMDVVGIAANVREYGPASDPQPTFYAALSQLPARGVQLAVRTTGDPMAVISLVKQAAARVDPAVPAVTFQTMETRFRERTAAPRFRTVLLGVFALLALVLAATGLYGVLAYLVATRIAEIGVRLALGASRREIAWIVLCRGGWLAGLGLLLGTAGALALSGVIRGLLFEVSPTDTGTFACVAATLGVVALAACLVPAWRAVTVDPASVLRQE